MIRKLQLRIQFYAFPMLGNTEADIASEAIPITPSM